MTHQLLLAYCKENEIAAYEIERELKPAGFNFKHLVCSPTDDTYDFNRLLQQQSDPILLLISDNYLKSKATMYNALPTIQNLINTKRLQPVVVDGYYLSGDEGGFEKVATQFDRIGQIIKYMNHWQEEYLNIRQKHRKEEGSQKAFTEKKLKITREISTQIGELLRYLRETNYWEYDWLKATNFEAFFRAFGNEASFREFAAKYAAKSEAAPVANIPNSSAMNQENMASVVLTEEVEETEEEPIVPQDVIISGIPGVDLLESPVAPQESAPIEEPPSVSKDHHNTPFTQDIDIEELEEETSNMASVDPIPAPPPVPPINLASESSGLSNSPQPIDDLEDIVEEVAREENQLNPQEEFYKSGDKGKDYEILQSIFEEDEEEEKEEEETTIHLPPPTSNEVVPTDPIHNQENAQDLKIKELFSLVQQAEANHDLLLAKSYYEKINSLDPDLEEVNLKLGLITASCFTNQEKQAIKYFKKALQINPKNTNARYQYATLLAERLNKPKKAIKQFLRCLKEEPEHPFANYDLALLYYQKGQLETATEYYEQAFCINPELKTEENDLAFNYVETEEESTERKDIQNNLYPELGLLSDEPVTEEIPVPELIDVDQENEEEEVIAETATLKAPKHEQQKTVLITGATSGIGLATANIFAQHGYRLILTGRRKERLAAIRQELQNTFQASSLTLAFDVRERKAMQKALKLIPEDWGNIDILINNAGLAKGFAPIHEGKIEDWETMIDTNVKGLLYMTRAIAPMMVKNRKGHIINVASTAGKEVYANGNVYCASKFAVDALTKAMRIDLHKHQIRVSQVAPGHVEETEFALVRFDGDSERAKIYEDFRPLTSRDVAETIYFIATRPPHVNIQDVLMMGTQQASSNHIDRSGR